MLTVSKSRLYLPTYQFQSLLHAKMDSTLGFFAGTRLRNRVKNVIKKRPETMQKKHKDLLAQGQDPGFYSKPGEPTKTVRKKTERSKATNYYTRQRENEAARRKNVSEMHLFGAEKTGEMKRAFGPLHFKNRRKDGQNTADTLEFGGGRFEIKRPISQVQKRRRLTNRQKEARERMIAGFKKQIEKGRISQAYLDDLTNRNRIVYETVAKGTIAARPYLGAIMERHFSEYQSVFRNMLTQKNNR